MHACEKHRDQQFVEQGEKREERGGPNAQQRDPQRHSTGYPNVKRREE
jgi:hypothetical protein